VERTQALEIRRCSILLANRRAKALDTRIQFVAQVIDDDLPIEHGVFLSKYQRPQHWTVVRIRREGVAWLLSESYTGHRVTAPFV
jgi:hypothetical protein